jgi:hypothetical protein
MAAVDSSGVTMEAGSAEGSVGEGGGAGDSAAGGAFAFQPSNILASSIAQAAANAQDESISSACSFTTDNTTPGGSCFMSPTEIITQPGGTLVNLIVVKSLTVAAAGAITVTGSVPLVIVSLTDVTISGSIDGASVDLGVGPGGAAPAGGNLVGSGMGGGAAGSDSAAVAGSGGSYCGVGGLGGGQTVAGTAYGTPAIRPLLAGSAGGGGTVGSGAGGGAIQISAAGVITLNASGSITVGGEGGPFGGLSSDQNAGGGGSGGAILLEAPTVTVTGTLAANGGGGGGDYSGTGGADSTPSAVPAPGGAGGADDAAGGAGGAATAINGTAGQTAANLNSGGGGGAVGWIRINSTSGAAAVNGVVSPASTTACVTQGTLRTSVQGP